MPDLIIYHTIDRINGIYLLIKKQAGKIFLPVCLVY